MSFRFKNLQQSDADKVLILIEAKRKLEQELSESEEKRQRLVNAIDDFLNDTREKESVQALEQAMKDYGKDKPE